jgi:hypothetical protein
MVDAHYLSLVGARRFDQVHLLEHQLAIGDKSLHGPFFRGELLTSGVTDLLLAQAIFRSIW